MSLRPDLVACWVYRVTDAGTLEFLLIKRAPGRILPGLWQCVTGSLEEGERVALGALRELVEETGFGPDQIEDEGLRIHAGPPQCRKSTLNELARASRRAGTRANAT